MYSNINIQLFFKTREHDLSHVRSIRVLNIRRKAVFTVLLAETRNGNVRRSKKKHVLRNFFNLKVQKNFWTFSKKLLSKQMSFEYLNAALRKSKDNRKLVYSLCSNWSHQDREMNLKLAVIRKCSFASYFLAMSFSQYYVFKVGIWEFSKHLCTAWTGIF